MRAGITGGSLVAALALLPAAAGAATISVSSTTDGVPTADGVCTVREAVQKMNADNGGLFPECTSTGAFGTSDTINLAAGHYNLVGSPEDSNQQGDIDVNDTDSLLIQGPVVGSAILDSTGTDRVIDGLAGSLTLNRVSVIGGQVTGANGGGIRAAGNLTFTHGSIDSSSVTGQASYAGGGGGIFIEGGTLTVDDAFISGNTVTSTIQTNGGGIALGFATPGTITDSTIQGNSVTNTTDLATGGGVSVPLATNNANTLTIKGSSFINNTADGVNTSTGGAVYWNDGVANTSLLRMENSTLSGNQALGATANQGGAIGLVDGTASVSHLTFAGNTATTGRSIYYRGLAGTGTFTARGSLFTENGADECAFGDVNTLTSGGGNHDFGDSCGLVSTDDAQFGSAPVDPLGANGGLTPTRALTLGGNGAVDRDTACLDSAGAALSTDQRGAPRSTTGSGTKCDAGAYERIVCQGLRVTVTGTSDSDVLLGTGTDDVIAGFDDHDTIRADAGDDRVCGGDGDDHVEGGPGADVMDGGTGGNYLTYIDSPGGVAVDLSTGTSTGAAGDDTFSNFPNVEGSPSPDTIAGDAQANVFFAGGGDDVLEGRGGDDIIDGGDVLPLEPGDRVVYDEALGAVSVDLSTTAPQGTLGDGTDSIVDVERVTGSSFDDSFRGAAGANAFDGGPGGDLVTYVASAAPVNVDLGGGTATGQGADTFASISSVFGSTMNDTLLGDGGPNLLNGLGGDDTITGAGGSDDLSGSDGADSIFARDGVADAVNCGPDPDSVESDAAGVDTLTACETISLTPTPILPTPKPPAAKPKCKKSKKAGVAKKKKCKKKPRK